MASLPRLIGVGLVTALICPLSLWAQYPSELVGFNGPPIDDPATSREMFQSPQYSGTTDQYIILNDPDVPYGNNAAFRASGLQTEGEAAMEVYFRWVDPADSQAWVRVTTFNGPDRPNPSLHTQGKVRFRITNRSEYTRGEVGICLGIRETGVRMPQLANGGTSGDIEWVGVTGVGPDPNNPVPIPAVTLPVPGTVGTRLEWDLATGIVSVDGEPQGGGIARFTGDGVLNAPNNRGTLEHIAFTNVTSDEAVLIDVAIDELQFEAPEPDPPPPPTIRTPVLEGDTEVVVDCIVEATEAELFLNEFSQGTVAPVDGVATFTDLVLTSGDVLTATQTANGIVSDPSSPALVYGQGISAIVINEFNYDDSGEPDNLAFVELYNRSDEPVDVGDWEIQVGDYYLNDDPNRPGVYYFVSIPPGTTIEPHGFWTVAMSDVTYLPGAVIDLVDDDLRLDNGMNYLALRNLEDVLLDGVAWETNKGPYYGYEFIPLDIYTQIGIGIWGNHVNPDIPLTAQSRYLDGLDSDNNGRDFGIQPATPGYSNNQADVLPYFENADSLNPLDPVPGWVFSYAPMAAFDPTDPDPNGPSGNPINPYAIPYSPDGGLALIAWDDAGGGNATYMQQLAQENFTLETYIYVAEEFTPSGYEETKVGVRGSVCGVHNFDYFSGATGLCWLLQRGTTWQVLLLLDENDGDDGGPSEPICATILGTIDIGTDAALTGWQRLLLEVQGDQVLGIFGGTYGSRDDGIQFTGTHQSYGPGGVYVSYREDLDPEHTWNAARPPSLDALSVTEPVSEIPGDVDGDGDVDLTDLASLLAAYGTGTGDPDYNPNADFDDDGDVDLTDLATLLANYGTGT
jgi:hypothetical protein